MLSVLADLSFAEINVNSVADGLDSTDDESKLGIQIRGIFNELQLQDLKKRLCADRSVRRNESSRRAKEYSDTNRFRFEKRSRIKRHTEAGGLQIRN